MLEFALRKLRLHEYIDTEFVLLPSLPADCQGVRSLLDFAIWELAPPTRTGYRQLRSALLPRMPSSSTGFACGQRVRVMLEFALRARTLTSYVHTTIRRESTREERAEIFWRQKYKSRTAVEREGEEPVI